MSFHLHASIPLSWLNRTDQSVLPLASVWIELDTAPDGPLPTAAAGYWAADPERARHLPTGTRVVGPAGSGRPGALIGSLDDLERAAEAEFLLLNGEDAAGTCGADGLFVLMQAVAHDPRPVWLRGAVGPALVAAAKTAGFAGVLAEEIVWPGLASLPEQWRTFWQQGSPGETRVFGPADSRVRFWARPGFAISRAAAGEAAGDRWREWLARHRARPERPGPRDAWLPAGGASGLAGRLGVQGTVTERLERLQSLANRFTFTEWPWRPGAGWADCSGATLPLSQGPMANVSDVPAFAEAVSRAGAFPWFALASTPPGPVRELLQHASRLPQPWGAGIIGMTTNPVLEDHIRLCREAGVRWLLVAAGTTSLAARLMNEGFEVVLHTPAPEMLEAALRAGVRHVIWEGREAGGHVGGLNAWSLWQHNLAVLEAIQPERSCSVLLAGGLGTPASALLAAPVGARIEALRHAQGLQIGSAYLRTKEAVATGAIATTYGEALKTARRTLVAGDQSGAPTRLLATRRAQELAAKEQEWIRDGMRISERKHQFERANFGGLRLAAKAQRVVIDDKGPRLEQVSPGESLDLGLFHIGENAALPLPETIADLHAGLTRPFHPGAEDISPAVAAAPVIDITPRGDLDDAIAIIGMSFWLPGVANDGDRLWAMLYTGGSAIDDIAAHPGYWNPDLFWDPDGTHPEKSYTRIGAFIDDPPFDGRRFRIPPRVATALDRTQLLGLILAEQAFADAGITAPAETGGACDVVLGIAQGDLRVQTDARILLEALALTGGGEAALEAIECQIGFSIPEPVADSMAGELANCCAGRIASAFDLRGANFTADAACASALAAIAQAVDRLRLGRCDLALTGGLDRNMSIGAFVKFCRLGALSRDGSFPFDTRASGFVMGEGGALFVLRRLRDAIRDGDRIRAIIRGTGLASDGRGKGITAPNPAGQRLAIERAWRDAGVGPEDLGYIEAHGTGTPVGDLAEAGTLRDMFAGRRSPLPIGSIKGNIGHLKAAAGAAGLAKTVLMMERRAIVPSGNHREPRPELELDHRPLHVATEPDSWRGPLRAGISAFGFGGTNAHLVVESGDTAASGASEDACPSTTPSISSSSASTQEPAMNTQTLPAAVPSEAVEAQIRAIVAEASGYEPDEIEPDLDFEADLGIDTVKIAEIIGRVRERFGLPEDPDLVLSDVSSTAAVARYVTQRLGSAAGRGLSTDEAETPAATEDIWTRAAHALLVYRGDSAAAIAAAVADNTTGGDGDWALCVERERLDTQRIRRGLADDWDAGRWLRAGAVFGRRAQVGTAWLFPGQGTQRPGMLAELRGVSVIDETIAEAATILDPLFDVPLAMLLSVPDNDADAEQVGALLRQTRYTQPVLLTVEVALMRLLQQAGWRPGAVAGHSLGEFAASVAAGVLSFEDALRIVSGRGRAMEEAAARIEDPGAMVAVGVDRNEAAALLERFGLTSLELANQNSPTQTVIGGATADIDRLCAALDETKVRHKRLNVSHAFHTSIVADASAPLRELLAQTTIRPPQIPIYSNVTARPYPDDVAAIRELLAVQLARPVRFVEMIEHMATHGVPAFVEVGAGRVLSGLAAEIVEQRLPAVPGYLPGQDPVTTLARVRAVQVVVASNAPLAIDGDADATSDVSGPERVTCTTAPATAEILDTVRQIVADASGYDLDEIEPNLDFEADLGIDTVKIAEIVGLVRERFGLPEDPDLVLGDVATAAAVADYVAQRIGGSSAPLADAAADGTASDYSEPGERIPQPASGDVLDTVRQIVADASGYDLDEIEPELDFEADLGIDTVKIAEIVGLVRERFGLPEDPDLVLGDVATAAAVADYVLRRLTPTPRDTEASSADAGAEPADDASAEAVRAAASAPPALQMDEIVVSGIAAAIPGHPEPFSAAALDSLLSGTNLIEPVSDQVRDRIVELGIESVSKDSEGRVRTRTIRDREETIQFRSRLLGEPDLTAFGVPKAALQVLDRSSRWAVAAGFRAVRDAALPLVEREPGDRFGAARVLPRALGERTGVIYASIFGGIDVWLDVATGRTPFPRTFMVESLSLAHSHFARFIGASGPTARLDAACASTVTALATAQDWLRNDRCDRVVIIACDLAGEDTLLPYVGGGFLAVGAASTNPDLEQAARPFGTGRAGTIIGSAALAMVLEKAGQAEARGLRPHARVAGACLGNDACHPLQMNPDHIAEQLDRLVAEIGSRYRIERDDLATRTVFVSHEPFTPARGGSAASEANALRRAFGARSRDIPVVNVKGYTGHPMAASIEDIVAVATLVHGRTPPVRNADKQDPELSDLRLSDGSAVSPDWVIHLAAGFGAQIAWIGYGRVPGDGPRLDRTHWEQWASRFTAAAETTSSSQADVARDTSVLSWAPGWRRRGTVAATIPLGTTWAPLADRLPLDARDVESIVAAAIAYCCAQRPDVVILPSKDTDTWVGIAAEAIAAAIRSLQKEIAESAPRLLWCDDEMPKNICDVPEQCWCNGALFERIWLPQPQRNARATAPAGDWILIGGGRGITGLLARRWSTVPGRTLFLVGRQTEPDDALCDLDDAALRRQARTEMGDRRDPRQFQALVERLERARELARTLRELRDAASEVRYIATDIAEPGAAERIAAAVGVPGAVTGIIHAAGIEASAAAKRTDVETVRRVMAPKLRGGLEVLRLARLCDDAPVIGFGSISAALGNHGQSAYGAANGALRALLDAAPVPAMTLEWSAWDGAGMATRGAIPELLRRQGISLMNPDAAFSELEAWLSIPADQRPASVVVADAGDAGAALPAPPTDAAACHVSGPGDPWVDDHRIDGVAVQPGVSGLAMLWSLRPDEGIRLAFRRAIRFPDDNDLLLSIINHNGHGQIVEHDAAHRPRRQPAWEYQWRGDLLPEAPAAFDPAWHWTAGPRRAAIYDLLFHGPRFQVLDDSWFGDGGAWATATILETQATRQHAMAVEAMFQLAGLWGAWKHQHQYLPVAVETHALDPDVTLRQGVVRVACQQDDGDELHFVGGWYDDDGRLLRRAHFTLRAAGPSAQPAPSPAGAVIRTVPVTRTADSQGKRAQQQASATAWRQVVGVVWCGLTGAPLGEVPVAQAPESFVHQGRTIAWSRTHTDQVAAAAARPGHTIGIDAETVVERPPAFWTEAASATERSRYGASPTPTTATMIWTAKEAVLKAAGTGLSVPLADLDVTVREPSGADVAIAPRSRDVLGFSGATVTFERCGDTIVAVAEPVSSPTGG